LLSTLEATARMRCDGEFVRHLGNPAAAKSSS
jgi:hypothetical protein